MKFISWIFLILFVLVGGLAILPQLVPMERVAAIIKERVKAETGRDLNFSNATLTIWPDLGVEMADVTFGNPSWAKEKNMLTLGRLNIALALQPLLHKQVEIKKFALDRPVIDLEVSQSGKKNWEFDKAESAPASAGSGSGGTNAAKDFGFKFGPSSISQGKLTFTDAQKGGAYTVSDINVTLTWPDFKSALKLEGDLNYHKKRVNLSLDVAAPMDLVKGSASSGHLKVKTEDISLQASGSLATQGEMFNGNVDTDITSLPKFLAWVSGGKEEVLPFQKVSFRSALRATGSDLVLKNAELSLDEVKAKGNLNLGLSGKPEIFARLSLNKLNLDRFTGEKGETGGGTGGKKEEKKGWDTTPIDLSGLKMVNADLELKTDGFSARGVDVGPSTLTVLLQQGNLKFKSSDAALFSGRFSSSLNINAAPTPPTMAFDFNMSGVQAKPILTTFADFKKLSGAVDADISVTSTGNNQKALISALKGDGSVTFKNGALEGIDLVNIAKLVQRKLTDMNVGEGKTDFVELGGKFTITNGLVSSDSLKMRGPLLQASGKGVIDLPQQYIQYRVTPVLTASSGVDNAAGIAVPVDIKGPFDHIKIKPDYASVVKNAIQNPENIKATAKDIRQQIKTIKKDPLGTLQNLLGGTGLLPPAQAPASATVPAPAPIQPEVSPQ